MGETQQQMSSNGAGNATAFSSKARRDRGVSDVQDVSPKINQDEFFSDLDSLINTAANQGGCTIGRMIKSLDEPLQSKLNDIMLNPTVQSARLAEVLTKHGLVIPSSDVLRRHRRRMSGKEGCKCPRES